MRPDYTHITFVLDRSGSMGGIIGDTIGGFNAFLAEQKALPGKATFSLFTFSDIVTHTLAFEDIQQTPNLDRVNYRCAGGTALNDAIGRAINDTGLHLAVMSERDRPAKVLLVILTDGEENASVEFYGKQIAEMITHQQEKYLWQVVYLGANHDAAKIASALGITASSTVNFDAKNMRGTMDSLSASTIQYRSGTQPQTSGYFGTPAPNNPDKTP